MNILESLNSAIKSLIGNRARSFLTMLGIIIGISSVITMSAIGKGGQQNITGDLKENGYGKYTISIDKSLDDYRHKYLFDDDLIEILEETGEFKYISPNISQRMYGQIEGRTRIMWTNIATPEYQAMNEVDIVYGRDFISFEYDSNEKIALIDQVTAKSVFGSEELALGEYIEVSKTRTATPIRYQVVGIFKNPYEAFAQVAGGRGTPNFIRIPLSTYERMYDSTKTYTSLMVEAINPEKVTESMVRAVEILEGITGVEGLYEVKTLTDGAESFDKMLTTLNLFITFVAGISLFVGGIGVMNIMLVSVIERTREIGIRKALGATNKDILSQFLIESVILTGTGGIIGITLGILLGVGIGKIVNIPPIFTATSIISALLVSMIVGIVFGVFPAKKAAELNPIEALRAE